MPVESKMATKAAENNLNPDPSPLKLALTYYYANRETPVTRFYPAKDRVPQKLVRSGISL